jgi:transcriptional regulator with XRE-family HTH domain
MPKRDTCILSRERLTRVRIARGVTRDALVAATGLAKMTVWAAHNGKPIAVATAVRIAAALGVELGGLVAAPDGGNVADGAEGAQREWGEVLESSGCGRRTNT